MSSYTGWYKDGTASVVNGSTAVTGVDTYWSTAGIHARDLLTFDDGYSFVEIAAANTDTSITLAKPFTGSTKANVSYAIIRNFTSGSLPEVASQVVEALGKYTRYFNEDIATLNGKSAYEVAVANGYSGTEAQWLESLKAAGEWSTLNSRTNILTYHSAAAHNALYRGKNLGTAITAEMRTNIINRTYADWYPGDTLTLPIDGTTTAYVIGCEVNDRIFWNGVKIPHVLLWLVNDNWKFSINDTATCEGHFYNSKMYTEHLPYILGKITEVIPAQYIIPWYEEIGDSIDSNGNVNHRVVIERDNANPVKIGIPSFCNIIGYNISENHAYNIAGRNPNWPAFRLNSPLRYKMIHKWLSESYDATRWTVLGHKVSSVEQAPANSTIWGTNDSCKVFPYIHIG